MTIDNDFYFVTEIYIHVLYQYIVNLYSYIVYNVYNKELHLPLPRNGINLYAYMYLAAKKLLTL